MSHAHTTSPETEYEVFGAKGHLVKAWTRGVAVDPKAKEQLLKTAQMPFIHKWVAAMPDVHVGIGATVGSVVASKKAIIPAAVGVDIGCGMMATRTTLTASDLPDNLALVRSLIERHVPHGRTDHGGKGDRGAWHNPPAPVEAAWVDLQADYKTIVDKHPRIGRGVDVTQLGTLGTGNHFIAVRAQTDDLGIIPGSMGARSFIVRGLGNPDSFHSCSHGAGRLLSRTEAKHRFTVADHARMAEGIECRKDADVVDETPAAYKPIEDVMAAQRSLVEVVHTLRQVVCVKG
jgi:RNA-splicing ligase RtcB